MKTHTRLLSVSVVLLFLCSVCLPAVSRAAGGDVIGSPYNVAVTDKQEAKASAVDSAGNLILVGSSMVASTDFHVTKINAAGDAVVWTVSKDSIGGTDVATAVVVDNNDDVIVTGYLWNGGTYNDIYTAKYAAADGALIWEHSFDGTGNGQDYPTAITVDDVGYVYVAGYMQDVSTKDSTILLKYHPTDGPKADGSPYWQYRYDAGNNGHDRLYALAVTDAGVPAADQGVVVTGETQTAGGDFDSLTIRYKASNTTGTPDRIWSYSDAGNGRGQALAIDSAGNAVMGGYVSDGANQDFYLIEYPADSGITANWVDIYDSTNDDHLNAIWLDDLDNVYVVGGIYGAGNGEDIYAAKHAGDSGVNLWRNSYNSSGMHNDMGQYIVGDNAGEMFVTGYKNDGEGGDDDFLTVKLKKDDGTLLWSREYDGVVKGDRAVGAGLNVAGDLVVGGWSDRWTAGSSDYDFLLIKYESGALNPPTALAAELISNSQVDLTWTDNATGEENFILERKIGEGGTATEITLGPDVVSYSDTGLTADTRYYYRVKTFSAATGDSPYSNEVNVKTTVVSEAAPSLQFQTGGAAGGDDYAQAIAAGSDNHPVVTGFITGAGTGFDYYTIKLDRADLTEQWNALYNDDDNQTDVANAITVDSSNRVVVTGYSSLYGGGAGNTDDVYTIGYPVDGSVESWTDQYNGPDGNDDRSSAIASAIDGSDNTVVVGYGSNAAANDDIYVIKLQPDGTRLWAATPYDNGNHDQPSAVAIDSAGNVLVAGYSENGSNKDFFVAKYSGVDGSQSWVKTFNGAGNGHDYVNALAVDGNDDLYVTGYSVNAAGNGDIYTIKYAGSDGTPLWQDGYDGVGNAYDIGEGITADPVDGSIMVGGTTFVGTGNHDYILIRYDTDGNIKTGWPKTLDRPGSDEALYAMSIDRSGTVCLTGTTDAGGTDDVLTVKYDSDGIVIGASIYNGVGNSTDAPAAVVTNNYGETFVAGFTTKADGYTDYMVFLADGGTMQSPTPFSAVQLYTQVDLSWADNSLDENGFRLQFKTGTCASANPWSDLYAAAAGETSYSHTGLTIHSTFCYQIQSHNASGDSSRWAELEVTTDDPIAPSGLSGTVLSTSEVQLDWTDNTGNEDGFIVERCLDAGCDFAGGFSIDTVVAPADAETFIDSWACPGETYSYRIKADNSEWTTGYSNLAVDQTVESPIAPTDFTVTLISESQVGLTWTDNSSDETGFRIERCTTSDCSSPVLAGTVPADEETTAMSFSDSGLNYNTDYWYRVTAYKTMGCVTPVYAYTPILAVTTTPPAPSSFTAVPVTSTQVNLTWVDGTAAEQGLKIERCQGAGCTPVEIATVAANSSRYIDATVCSGQDYRYRVRTYSGVLWDSGSSIVDVSVPAPLTPGSFSVTTLSEEAIRLNWSMTGYDLNGYFVERCSGGSCTPVTQEADISSSAILALSMEEASWSGVADEVKDSSGNNNHGRSYNGPYVDSAGKVGWAGNFDGANDFLVTAATIDQSSSGGGATFEAWVYPETDNVAYRGVISTENGGYDWTLFQYGTTWRIYTGSTYWTIGSVTKDAWQHVMVVFEPGVGTHFYHNGVKYSTGSIGYDTSANPVNIGRRASGVLYFDGKIDEVLVYDRALSDAEALARYNGGNTTVGTLAGSYTDSGLAPDTTYGYQLKSYSDNDCTGSTAVESSPTAIAYATTLSPPPPSGFTATTINSTRIDLAWTDNTDSETGFIVKRCSGSGTACDEISEFTTTFATTAANVVSYVDNTGCAGQTYTYWLAADKNDGPTWTTSGIISNSVTTWSVATPVDFAATAISESQIDLTWTDTLSDKDTYVLQKCSKAEVDCLEGDYAELGSLDLSTATLWLKMDEGSWGTIYNSATGGSNGTKFGDAAPVNDAERGQVGRFDGNGDYVQIPHYAALNSPTGITVATWAKSNGATWSNDHTLLSKRSVFILSPIIGDTGMRFYVYNNSTWTPISVSGATLGIDITKWHHYAGTYDGSDIILYIDGVEVGRVNSPGTIGADSGVLELGRDDGSTTRYLNGWMDDAMVFNRSLDATEIKGLLFNTGGGYQDLGLSSSTPYSYRLRSNKLSAACAWTTDWETREESTLAPPPPTDLSVIPSSTTSFAISWTDNSGSEANYHLRRCPGSGTACDEDAEYAAVDNSLAPDTDSYTDATVCDGQTYSYQVRAEKGATSGWPTSWDGPVVGTTPVKVAPSGLTATLVSEVQIDLAWNDNTSDESSFALDRCLVADCSSIDTTISLAADSTSYQDDQLDPQVTYYYRIRALKPGACGWPTDYSAIDSQTTTVALPSGLLATTIHSAQIDLSWTDNSAAETATIIERCTGDSLSCNDIDFAYYAEVSSNVTSYSDSGACAGTTYSYRLKIKNDGLEGGGTWTRRKPLSFSGFSAGKITSLTVPYDAGMRTDFGDLRFYDGTTQRPLLYSIASKTDGVTATIQLQLGQNQNVYMYYGNPTATDIGKEENVLLFYDDFSGTQIDSNKWVEIDPNNSIGQDNDLLLIDVSDAWTKALISKATFSRVVGRELYVNMTIPADTAGNNYMMIGWEMNQTNSAHFNQLVHGLYWYNYNFRFYEKGVYKGASGSYLASTDYEMKMVLKSNGAQYYIKGGAYASWTLLSDLSNYSDATMRIAFTQSSHQANIHAVKVRDAVVDTGASLGAEETSAGFAFGNIWEEGYSNESEATTTSPVTPSGLAVVAISDTQFNLNWTDNTAAETGFEIERCSGGGCSYVYVDTVGANVTSYSDTTAPPSTESTYRVKAIKSYGCAWPNLYSNTDSDLSFPAASGRLAAVALNAQAIQLDWDDDASDEDGYKVEVQLSTGDFIEIMELSAGSTSFIDRRTVQAEKEYFYRIRPYRGVDMAPYSEVASATVPNYADQANTTCYPDP